MEGEAERAPVDRIACARLDALPGTCVLLGNAAELLDVAVELGDERHQRGLRSHLAAIVPSSAAFEELPHAAGLRRRSERDGWAGIRTILPCLYSE